MACKHATEPQKDRGSGISLTLEVMVFEAWGADSIRRKMLSARCFEPPQLTVWIVCSFGMVY